MQRLPGTLAPDRAHAAQGATCSARWPGPAFEALRPAVRQIDSANRQLRPLAETAEPVLRKQVRPFVRARAAVRATTCARRRANLAKASPDLRESLLRAQPLLQHGGLQPGRRARALTGDAAKDLARDEGLLFWLGWVAHNSNSLFSTGDAQGPVPPHHPARHLHHLPADPARAAGAAAPLVEDRRSGCKDLLADTDLCPPS